jgi:uncharacterized lipoprotein YajG
VNIRKMRSGIWMVPLLAVLGGCVAGQTIPLDYTPAAVSAPATNVTVTVKVQDRRDYVVSGNKDAAYIGHYRAGLGNTWDVKTRSHQSLASHIERDLGTDLQALGFKVGSAGATRQVQVTIKEWNFDGYIDGKVWCEMQVAILDPQNKVLYRHELKESRHIAGSVMTGVKSATEREVPALYRDVIRKLVRDDAGALQALRQ